MFVIKTQVGKRINSASVCLSKNSIGFLKNFLDLTHAKVKMFRNIKIHYTVQYSSISWFCFIHITFIKLCIREYFKIDFFALFMQISVNF